MRQFGRPLAILGALACALSAWLLAPLHAREEGAATHVCLVDASQSITAPRDGWPEWARGVLRAEAQAAARADRDLVVVRFGRDLARVFGPAPAAEFDAGALDLVGADGSASDLNGALELTRGLTRGRSTAQLVLLSDGSFTGTRPDRELARFAAEGAQLTWREPPAPDRADAALVALRLPPEPAPGAPLACVVEGLLQPAGVGTPGVSELELSIEIEDAAGTRVTARRIRVQQAPPGPAPGAVPWTARLDLGSTQPGLTRLACRVTLLEEGGAGDPFPGNDRLQAVLRAGAVRVGLVCAAAEHEAAAEAWVAGASELGGLQLLRVRPAQLPDLLPDADLLVSFDLSERDLGAADLAGFIERGGGWLACGGLALLAGQRGPLTPLAPAAEERERRRVLLLVDGSGSMRGAAFEGLHAAVLRLLTLAPAEAIFELAFFTDHIEAPQALPVADPGAAARALLSARAPGGPTDLWAALEPLEARARGAPGGLLVFLLSDGREQPSDADARARARALLERLTAADCEVVPVAMGPDADPAALGVWCVDGTQVLAPADADALFRSLLDRAARDWTRALPELGVRAAAGAGLTGPTGPTGVAQELRAALAARPLPPVERHLRARPARPVVDVLLETLEGQPLLVLERHAAGSVAALCTLPARGWAPAWAGRPEVLAPLLRALARGRELHGPRASLEDGELVLRGVPRDWPARVWVWGAGSPLDLPPSAAEAAGADPLEVRRGPAPPAGLPGLTLGAGPEPGAELLARLPLPAALRGPGWELAEESRLPARRVDRGALPPTASAAGSAGAPGGRGAGLGVLGLGLACLALAAGLGWERSRTPVDGPSS